MIHRPTLLVTGDFGKTGGMDWANRAVAHYLARQGTTVHLVAHQVSPDLTLYPTVHLHPAPKPANSYLLGSLWLDRVGRKWAQRVHSAGGRVIVNGGNCAWGDVNWVHYVHAAFQAERQSGTVQGMKTAIAHTTALQMERRAFGMAKQFIANSDRTRSDLMYHYGIPSDRIHTVYCGIDPDEFYPASTRERDALRQELGWATDRPIVAFVGALGDRRKGFDLLFSAWQMLCADPDWTANLVVVGDGAELACWQHRAREAKLGDRIHFLGFRKDVPNLLRAADCLVAPSRYESYGLGVQEVLCCGLPAIVSVSAGIAERYPADLHELLLLDPENIPYLIATLRHWHSHQTYYQQQTQAFAHQLRQYTWDDMAEALLTHLSNNQVESVQRQNALASLS